MVRQYGRNHIFACHPDPSVVGNTPEDFKQLPVDERLRYQVVRGHFGFGLHRAIGEPSTYVTVVRDPVDRAISHFHYARKRSDHYLHEQVVAGDLGLKEYVLNGISIEMDNGQTRMLASRGGYTTPFGECSPELLEQAKANLREHFAIVGTSERFDETLVVAQEILGWSLPLYLSWNVSQNRLKREELTPDVVEAIYQQNALDRELYRYVDELLDELIAKHVRFFRLKLLTFRLLNWLYARFFKLSRSFPKSWQDKLDRHFFKLIWES